MVPREYPHLVVGNAPAMDVEPLQGRRRRMGWLAACSFALLLGAGVTATVVSTPPEPPKKPPVAAQAQPDMGADPVLLSDPDEKKLTQLATPPTNDLDVVP